MLSEDIQKGAVRHLGQKAEFLGTTDRLGSPGGTEFIEGAATVGLDGIFGNEELRGDFAVAEPASNAGENFQLARRDAKGLQAGRIGNKGMLFRSGDENFDRHRYLSNDHCFANRFAIASEPKAEPDSDSREEDGD